jgi:YHS domain-containing protein
MLYRFASMAVLLLAARLIIAGDFSEENGVALGRFDAVSYSVHDHQPMLGTREFSTVYKGSTFYFITNSNLHTFLVDPERYAPQFGGFCAYNAAQGQKIAASPRVFALVDGKLYLFSNGDARKNWKQDVAGNVARATEQWANLSKLVAQQ